jgi:hypothetical protein
VSGCALLYGQSAAKKAILDCSGGKEKGLKSARVDVMLPAKDKDRRPERWKYDQVPLEVDDDDGDDADDLDYLDEDRDALDVPERNNEYVVHRYIKNLDTADH